MKRYCLPIAAWLLTAAALAQPLPDAPAGREERVTIENCDTICPAGMGKERKMLEAVRISRMTEALDFSEEQIAKFFPRLRKMEESLRAFDKQRDDLVTELEKLLADSPKEADLRSKLDQIDKIEEQKLRRRLADRAELDALLSLSQRAKLRVFNERFEDEIRSMVRTIRERRMKHLRP